MAKDKYRECTKCKTVHIIHRSFKDRCPTCFRCGGTFFVNALSAKVSDRLCPIYCDWNLQHSVDIAAEKISEFILSRHAKEINSEVVDNIKQYLVFAANSSRRDFAFSKEGFEKFSKPIK